MTTEPALAVAERYDVRDRFGKLVAVHQRRGSGPRKKMWFELPDGRRSDGDLVSTELPLFGSELLARRGRDDLVVLAEGEKAATAVQDAGLLGLGTVCGAATVPSDAVLAVFIGRRVALWPDADPVGRKHMTTIAKALERLGVAELRWIDVDGAPAHDDAADHDPIRIREYVEAARALPLLPPDPDVAAFFEGAEQAADAWLEPEDRGSATLSALGGVEYVEDLVPPGRIVVAAAEEGAGKSYAIDGELGIRIAVAGGSFAGTWPILRTGPVLVLSEMHPDDDFAREETILAALDLDRAALTGRYFRLPLMTAAGGQPALTVPSWRSWVTAWMREHKVILLVIDTATGATAVDPWGKAIQDVYRDLRTMLADYPELAIVLVLHLKKPQGRGERRISDVLGEWGRWNDVTVMLEADGMTRTKITTHKRVRHQRRIVATKADGLLVEPVALDEGPTAKVPQAAVVAAIAADPGIGQKALAKVLGVSASTASKYAEAGERDGLIRREDLGRGKGFRLYPAESGLDPQPSNGPTGSSVGAGPSLDGKVNGSGEGGSSRSTHPVGVDPHSTGPSAVGLSPVAGMSVGDEMATIFGVES